MRITFPGLYILLGLVLAGLIHITAVLTLPLLAPRNAQARLAELGPVNTMIPLPVPAPGRQVMPMMAPDVRYASCRYDLTNGPVRVRASGADDLWLIAFYSPEGSNFYTVAGSDLKQADIELVIVTGDQTVTEADVDSPEALDHSVVVNSPSSEGIVLIRAPLAGPSGSDRAEAALKGTTCGPYTVAR
ncbi:MAG: DUF1254 domain-containing protein [Methyloceanibacter sp.]